MGNIEFSKSKRIIQTNDYYAARKNYVRIEGLLIELSVLFIERIYGQKGQIPGEKSVQRQYIYQ
ncbi:hypothetical protein CW304_28000 [Bacillus sp. UFRGS-B20]|nr:hypothetical protein CW304_28000 [Bacillus sp. UFRGS-B20]